MTSNTYAISIIGYEYELLIYCVLKIESIFNNRGVVLLVLLSLINKLSLYLILR